MKQPGPARCMLVTSAEIPCLPLHIFEKVTVMPLSLSLSLTGPLMADKKHVMTASQNVGPCNAMDQSLSVYTSPKTENEAKKKRNERKKIVNKIIT